ncbi:hypothetical protein D3C74_180840 [compost metagenome]
MPYPSGGRGDKLGNRFEFRWAVYQILQVLDEKIDYFILEALGDDEQGVDIWIGRKDGIREGQQCKGRSGSKEYWEFGTANSKGIFKNWKFHLDRDITNTVSLVSPLVFTLLEDTIDGAMKTNDIPKDFYNNQILTASKEVRDFFRNFCKAMDLNPEQDNDLIKCISYLKRITYRQFPDKELKEIIISKISLLFIGNEEEIYDTLVSWIVEGNIWGSKISQFVLYKLFNEKGIKLKQLANDSRLLPRIEELNREFSSAFIPFNDELIDRTEFLLCRNEINLGNSLLIHGKAGRGKSGCTEDVISYCKENAIPYIAIKLDKRTPSGNAEKWGNDLGLPASIVHCIHSVSKTEKAVIILDQLDALRWTQAHSKDALLVCAQVINQVERLNIERENKISVVFVCRTYDLENDNNIKSLFKTSEKISELIQWSKIQVNELNDETVRAVIGSEYANLTGKLKEILRIPSNIYIWDKLDKGNAYNECSTANHLVTEWWRQLTRKCFELGLSETDMNRSKENLINNFDKSGRICVPIKILNVNNSCLEFLSSYGFLVVQDDKVSFAHQSILDCFLVEKMLIKYYEIGDILEVIGNKEKQTPGRRYQVQMLLQNLVEFDSDDFLNAGQKMLASNQIRYSVKFVFFEILNQLDILDENIQSYIVENCENELYGEHIINNVVYSRPQYIRLLRDYGFLEKWFRTPQKKNIAINLFISLAPNYEIKDVEFILKHAFQSQEDDDKFSRCFSHDINLDSDEMFELRMEFYNRYPQMADTYLDIKEMLKKCEIRTIRVFAFLLENKLGKNGQSIYRYAEEFLQEDSEVFLKNGQEVIDILLPYIPVSNDEILSYGDWSGRSAYSRGLERTSIEILKKANAAIINVSPKLFLERYKEYIGTGKVIFNEIILDALYKFPYVYSDFIIEYLCSNFDNNIFEKTSGNGDELLLAKQVLKKHSEQCKQDVFDMLEKKVIGYVSPRATATYKSRIQYNREHKGYKLYWSFWGDLQKEILEVLPYNRLSNKAKDLVRVLNRKFNNETTLYRYSNGHSGWVTSSIAGKTLSNKKWLGILTNQKLNDKRGHHNWKEVSGGFLENSVELFSSSFSDAVSKEPVRMIKLMLSHDEIIMDVYVDSLFSGVAHSSNLANVPLKLLEEMILKYLYDYTSYRASYICTIIENREEVDWSQEILDILKDIAIKHKNPEIGKPNVTSNEDKDMRTFDMLQSNALNCVRGKAARSIAHLLWKDNSFFGVFKDVLEKLVVDQNPAVRLASLFALWPSYNIDREWASKKIINLFKQDHRLAGFHGTKDMLFLLYPQYRQSVLEIIKQCYTSEDKDLIEIGAYCLSEMFILKENFEVEMADVDNMSELQAQKILYMVILYFNNDQYNHLAKNIIRRFKTSTLDLEMSISRLFYDNLINLDRDKDFLIEIMNSNLSRRTLHSFVYYLEKESKSIIEYKDIILSMSRHLIDNQVEKYEGLWGVQDEISKLIIGLYDETSGSKLSKLKCIAQECLDIWDLMFEKQIGPVRRLSREMMER